MRGGPRGDDGGEDSGDSSSHSYCCDSCHGSDGSAISVVWVGERRVASTFEVRVSKRSFTGITAPQIYTFVALNLSSACLRWPGQLRTICPGQGMAGA
jgi:hypothetical protein